MFLDYFALVLLLMSLTAVFYLFIYIHDLPHKIAKGRDHPHEEAIHVACWLSVFTLHAIWPIVYLWAISPRARLPVVLEHARDEELAVRVAELEQQLAASRAAMAASSNPCDPSTRQSSRMSSRSLLSGEGGSAMYVKASRRPLSRRAPRAFRRSSSTVCFHAASPAP